MPSKTISHTQPEWITGKHACLQTIHKRPSDIQKVLLTKSRHTELASTLPALSCIHITDNADITKRVGEHQHQGIAVYAAPSYIISLSELTQQTHKKSTLLAIDTIEDPQNLGAICRSSAAFSVDAILVTQHHIPGGTHWKKIASGALNYTRLCIVTNMAQALQDLKEHDFWCIGLAEEGDASLLHEADRLIYVVGGEQKGLRPLVRKHCDALVSIPTNPDFSTLNMAHACSIVLAQRFQHCARK